MKKIPDIYIIGSGNLAHHLIKVFVNSKLPIKGFWSRNQHTAKEIETLTNVSTLSKPDFFKKEGIFFICVNDIEIEKVAQKLKNKVIVHCAGSVHINTLLKFTENAAVFYPLQTFSKSSTLNFKNIPILVEATNKTLDQILKNIAKKIKCYPVSVNSNDRIKIHIAAVFANNFSNFMITLAQEYLKKEGFNETILNSLLFETYKKAIEIGGINAQTGPSVRNDSNTIKKHLQILEHYPELKKIYSFVSDSIHQFYRNNE